MEAPAANPCASSRTLCRPTVAPPGDRFFVDNGGFDSRPPSACGTTPAMAKLYFSYAAMNAGKSTLLLQASYNYVERGMRTLLFTSALYAEGGVGVISSRIGIKAAA